MMKHKNIKELHGISVSRGYLKGVVSIFNFFGNTLYPGMRKVILNDFAAIKEDWAAVCENFNNMIRYRQ